MKPIHGADSNSRYEGAKPPLELATLTQRIPIVEIITTPAPTVVYRDGLLRLPEVSRLTGLGRSAIYERMGMGAFPLARSLGGNAVAWLAGEVLDWIKALPPVAIRQAKPRS